MKNEFDEFKKLGQRIEQCLGSLVTKIAKAEDSQTSHSRHLLAKLPSQGLMRDASNFFMNRDDWTILPKNPSTTSTQPQTKEDFDQRTLFYNQHVLKWALCSSLLSPTDSTWTPLDSSGLKWSLLNCYFRA